MGSAKGKKSLNRFVGLAKFRSTRAMNRLSAGVLWKITFDGRAALATFAFSLMEICETSVGGSEEKA